MTCPDEQATEELVARMLGYPDHASYLAVMRAWGVEHEPEPGDGASGGDRGTAPWTDVPLW